MPKRSMVTIILPPDAIKAFKRAQKNLAGRWNCKLNQAALRAVLTCDGLDDSTLGKAGKISDEIKVVRSNTEELLNKL